MGSLLMQVIGSLVATGTLRVTAPNGTTRTFGDGTGPPCGFAVRDKTTAARLLIDPDLALGEAYVDGGLTITEGSLFDVIDLLARNCAAGRSPAGISLPYAIRRRLRTLRQKNPVGTAQRNVAHHYDLSGELYDLFLDADRQYSCAWFPRDGMSLEEAQLAKKRHLAAKLAIRPGMRVLDIGSGWGGLAIYLAEICGAKVTGVTLSKEQHAVSTERVRRRGLDGAVDIRLLDYRELDEPFDRIVSVGMFEHVGVNHYREFFSRVAALLAPDGVAVLHSIGRAGGPGATSAWIDRYIFPGGYAPALSEVVPHVEANGLILTDVEVLRLHYAKTLAEWRRRFAANRDRVRALYDERFCRMWEFYLAGSQASFLHLGLNNFQVQMARNQHALPLTRDYMAREEERLARIETNPARRAAANDAADSVPRRQRRH